MKPRKKPIGRRGKTPWKKARERADAAWSLLAKHEQGWCCQVCGKLTGLETHHYQPKGTFPKLRYDRRNAVVLCASHHRYDNPLSAHHDPAFHDWFKASRPADHAYLSEFKPNDSIKRSASELLEIASLFEAEIARFEKVAA